MDNKRMLRILYGRIEQTHSNSAGEDPEALLALATATLAVMELKRKVESQIDLPELGS